jgi:hypothetical protein
VARLAAVRPGFQPGFGSQEQERITEVVSEYIEHVLGATSESAEGDEPSADAHTDSSVHVAELPRIRCETCAFATMQPARATAVDARDRPAGQAACARRVSLHANHAITSLVIHGIHALFELGYVGCAVPLPTASALGRCCPA